METAKTVGVWIVENRDALMAIAALIGGLTKKAWIVDGLRLLTVFVPKAKP